MSEECPVNCPVSQNCLECEDRQVCDEWYDSLGITFDEGSE